mmetsp:Transcript_58358/g.153250  ORF Transcript_58358/g.153250 Transcript_58358/m.153250 type:complete len:246 (+) Transcript_58358:22-759(+)
MKLAVALLCLAAPCSHALLSRPAVLPTHRCPSSAGAARATAVRAAHSTDVGIWRRVVGGVRNALFVGAASVLIRSPDAQHALAAKAPPKPVPTKPASEASIKGLTALATIGMGGGLVYWSIKEAAEEDEEEQRRVVDETERLERMAKEYTDIDEGVTVDEDLFASLRTRLNSTETITGSEADEGPAGGLGPLPPPPPPPPAPAGGAGSAVLEPPAPGPPADEPEPGASPEDIEQLKRMFGSNEGS